MTLPPMSADTLKLNPELAGALKTQPASKYKNVRAVAAGLRFQSGHEATEIGKLILLDEKHIIFGLRLQVKFKLPGGNNYIADAVFLEYDEQIGQLVIHIIDCKGYRTPEFRIKEKLFESVYGQEIELIYYR